MNVTNVVLNSSAQEIRGLDRLFDITSDKVGKTLLTYLQRGPVLVGTLEEIAKKDYQQHGLFSETEALGKLIEMQELGMVQSKWFTCSPPQRKFALTDAGKRLAEALKHRGP